MLSQAVAHFSPVRGEAVTARAVAMSRGHRGLLVIVVWLAVFLALGAWRTRTMDA